ncbi:MAG: class I SAM-dependent methyltransferase [Deltaproteobacteria bacterium]|nr:MAG: class I SAM-dependent methyltransferase [Deltaproteobacteria bacterium]
MTTPLYGTDLAYVHIAGFSGHAEQAVPWIVARLDALRTRLGPGLVIDLGCGGGPVLRAVVDAGHEALGIDASPAMVAAARALVPEAEVRCASLVDADLPRCHAVLIVGEPLNYLDTRDEQRAVLEKIHAALVPGGLLLFDVRLPAAAQSAWRTLVRKTDDWFVVAQVLEEVGVGALTREVTTFVRDGDHFRRSDETHRMLLTGATTVLGWLDALGFDAQLHEGYGDYKPDRVVGVFEATRVG